MSHDELMHELYYRFKLVDGTVQELYSKSAALFNVIAKLEMEEINETKTDADGSGDGAGDGADADKAGAGGRW